METIKETIPLSKFKCISIDNNNNNIITNTQPNYIPLLDNYTFDVPLLNNRKSFLQIDKTLLTVEYHLKPINDTDQEITLTNANVSFHIKKQDQLDTIKRNLLNHKFNTNNTLALSLFPASLITINLKLNEPFIINHIFNYHTKRYSSIIKRHNISIKHEIGHIINKALESYYSYSLSFNNFEPFTIKY